MKQYLKKHLINSRGTRIKDKVVVIESDDWGAIRIPNSEVQELLVKEGLIRLKDPFSAYDCLENAQDYQALIQVLEQFRDKNGKHPILTANMVMGNPDFEQIKSADYQFFYWEPFDKTYASYSPQAKTKAALMQGIEKKVIYPQFHAYVHLNQAQWLQRLQSGDTRFLKAFEVHCFAIDDKSETNNRANLMATYDFQSESELQCIKRDIAKGLAFFEETFGFPSATTIAPCYVWNDRIEQALHAHGVQSLQSSYVQQCNNTATGKHERIWQKMGAVNALGQRYFVRNVLFEPALDTKLNWVEKALESISVAFLWNKPAIICSHRINFVSGLSLKNREYSLTQLHDLLEAILKKWPDVQFMHSANLNQLYLRG